MPNYEVPSWILPPSQAQERQLKIQEDAVRERAGQMLRKQVGMSRMRDEASTLQAQGVDPLTARKTALFNNAHLLFGDNPGMVERLIQNEDTQQVRAQAAQQLFDYRTTVQDRLRARDDQIAEYHQGLLDEHAAGRLTKEELDSAKLKLDVQKQQTALLKAQLDAQSKDAERAIRQAREDRLSGKTQSQLGTVEKAKVQDLRAQISELNKQRAKVDYKDPDYPGFTKRIADLQKQINTILDSAGQSNEPAPKPTGRVKVKKPDGTIGTISAENLDEAIKAGWTEVK